MQSPTRTQSASAFTLIEILVVIAIIAILAAILFPVFARARENARRASCQSNVKQILLGILQYTQDYDERFPLETFAENAPGAAFGAGNDGENVLWPQTVQPYLKSIQIFQCPSSSVPIGFIGGWPNPNPVGYVKAFHTDYLANNALFYRGSSSSVVSNPSGTVLLADGAKRGLKTPPYLTDIDKNDTWSLVDPTTDHNGGYGTSEVDLNGRGLAAPNPRHLNTVVVGFVDGHVKALQPSKFYYGDSPWLDPLRGGS